MGEELEKENNEGEVMWESRRIMGRMEREVDGWKSRGSEKEGRVSWREVRGEKEKRMVEVGSEKEEELSERNGNKTRMVGNEEEGRR